MSFCDKALLDQGFVLLGRHMMENNLVKFSQSLRQYFKNGSFAIAIYPYLMHPCVRHSITFFTRIVAILSAYAGVFYLFGEQVTILFSDTAIAAYIHHSTLELLFPIGTIIDDREMTLSHLPEIMRAVLSYQAAIFVPLYLFGIYRMSNKRYWLFGLLFAIAYAIGMHWVSALTSGHYTEAGLQNFGFTLTIMMGNLTLLFSGFDLPKTELAKFKNWTLWLGIIGLIGILITLAMPTLFHPVLERISLYTIMIWEIAAGFTMLKNHRLKNEF